MSDTQRVELCTVADVTSARRIFAADYVEEGVPFYRGKEITELHNGQLNVATELFIKEEYFSYIESKYGSPKNGDVLLTAVGTLGSVYCVKEGDRFYFKDGNIVWFRNLVCIQGEYLKYWLKSPDGRAELKRCVIGSSQSAYTIDRLKKMTIALPSLERQQRVVATLGAYDSLIEVNRRRIAALEAMARGLFEEWFVHFRFPGHENHKITHPPEGPLPEGWRFDTFNSILAHTIGGLWGSDEPTEAEDCSVRVIRGTDFPRLLNGTFSSVPQRFVAAKQLAERTLNSGDIVLEASGGGKDQPVGRTIFLTDHLLRQMAGTVAPASFCRLVRAMPAAGTAEYVFCLLQRMYEDGRIEKFQKQSTGLRNLSMRTLVAENIAVPDAQVIATFGRFVRPWLDLAASLRSETAVLAAARDLLLPRLISGELSVTASERVLEAAI